MNDFENIRTMAFQTIGNIYMKKKLFIGFYLNHYSNNPSVVYTVKMVQRGIERDFNVQCVINLRAY